MGTINNTFLILTALKETLPKENKNILFIGKWCLPIGKNNNIMPSLFDAGDKMNEAYKECDTIYKNILTQLVSILNKIHNSSHDYKSYELILGNWLKIYIHQLYEKYQNIKYAYNNYDIKSVKILDLDNYYTPLEYSDYMNHIVTDEYNLEQYSQIIKFLNYDFKPITLKNKLIQKNIYIKKSNIQIKLFEKTIQLINKLFTPKVTVTSPYFSSNTLINYLKLYFSSIGYYNIDSFNKNIEIPCNINTKIRENIKLNYNDEFENLLSSILPSNIPSLFIEGFSKINQISKQYYNHKTKLYYTANALHNNYLYKCFLANYHNELILTSHQHGGGYGLQKNNISENHERSVTDKFFTWGWKEKNANYLPHEKLTHTYKNNNKNTKIFMPLTGLPRYLHRFQDQFFSSLYIKYQNNLIGFLGNISNYLQNNILIRDYPNYYGWDTDKKIKSNFSNVQFDDRSKNFNDMLLQSRVVISLHLSTTYQESMSRNIPTLIYIDKEIYQFREESLTIIDDLYKNNIIFYDLELLSTHLENVYSNVNTWWLSDKVQKAKNNFLYKHARPSKNFVKEWKVEFDKLIEENNDN